MNCHPSADLLTMCCSTSRCVLLLIYKQHTAHTSSAHPNPLALSATMSGMTWAAITAGHWGFMALGLILGATIGALALALAAAAKQGDSNQDER